MNRKVFMQISFTALTLFVAQTMLASELTIVVSNIKEKTGNIHVSVFKGKEAFDSYEGLAVDPQTVSVETASVSLKVELEPGEYALRVYHDVDSNGKLNTNAMRMPKEPYAFSNNAVPRFGPPGWKATKFTVADQPVTQELTLRH